MNKVGEVSKENSNPFYCAILGISLTIAISILIFKMKPFDIVEYFNNKEKFFEIVMFIPVMFSIFFIHELIHMKLFVLFGKGEAKIKVKREKKYGAVVIHQVNEAVYYNKREILIILLSPLIILSIILLGLMYAINMPFLIYFNLLLNVLGSSIDFYVSINLLFRYPKDIKVNFNSNNITMNILKSKS